MKYVRRCLVWLLVCSTLLALLPLSADAQAAPDDSARDDLRGYAAHFNVSLAEAERRHLIQDMARTLQTDLVANAADTYAGLWLEHTPEFRVVVAFTRDGAATIAPYLTDRELAAAVDVRAADTSLADLERDQLAALQAIRAAGIPVDMQLNVKANQVEILAVDAEARRLEAARAAGQLQLPVTAVIIRIPSLSEPAANIYGGLALSTCTIGFGVKTSGGTKGVLTAAHCADAQSYAGKALTYKWGTYTGSHDAQFHTTTDFVVTNQVRGKAGALRSILYTWPRPKQLIDEYVCKYGMMTSYTCGYISDKNYAPSYVPAANATFIHVTNDAGYANVAVKGDSGGPWFSGNYAYGITSGTIKHDATHADGIYMPVDYVGQLIVSIMTSP